MCVVCTQCGESTSIARQSVERVRARQTLYRQFIHPPETASMAHHDGGRTYGSVREQDSLFKPNSAMVARWPAALSLTHDIAVQGKAAEYKRQLDSALRTRGLLRHILEAVPSYADFVAENKGADPEDIQNFYDKMVDDKERHLAIVADLLNEVIVWESLLQHEKDTLNTLISSGRGDKVYAWLVKATTLTSI